MKLQMSGMRQFYSVTVLAGAMLLCGCNGANGGGDKGRSMSRSSGQFGEGRKDGLRDAKDSIFDKSGGWMWLWMKSPEYRTGYDQGWNEGKYMQKMKSHQRNAAKTHRDEHSPAPAPKGE